MRKRIISFLFAHKILRIFLPLFHRLIGGSRIEIKRRNTVDTTTANIYKSRISFGTRQGNQVYIGENTDLHNATITFKGNNNSLKIGANCFLNGLNLIVEGSNNSIDIGSNVFVLDDTRVYVVDGSRVTIGDGCMFSDHIEIRTTDNHAIFDRSTGKRINYEKDIILSNCVWLGMHTILLKGTCIAEGCIVGAGSVVTGTHNTANTILVGNPAKEVKANIAWSMERADEMHQVFTEQIS